MEKSDHITAHSLYYGTVKNYVMRDKSMTQYVRELNFTHEMVWEDFI